ncbi:hypothetical protein QJS04_geneDACA010440 [Acorus gramineus]|uniref:Uncharacterized protein n=1 Tax=Acorus gramineus TaxID=55184 RepID=A0AAV9A2B7_ACOGR|nr:hypothetical protein QJS04_geneDACA010440 [Acorus gramineus]
MTHCYLLQVWDRRCLNAKGQPSGVLVGHLEGITFLDSRGDGRYLISNGKDQCTKLWDIRRMSSNDTWTVIPKAKVEFFLCLCSVKKIRRFDWDYRWMPYPPQARHLRHPCDQSLATYRGHSVLRTLIRCYFSPVHSYPFGWAPTSPDYNLSGDALGSAPNITMEVYHSTDKIQNDTVTGSVNGNDWGKLLGRSLAFS